MAIPKNDSRQTNAFTKNLLITLGCFLIFSFDAHAQWTSLTSGTTSDLNDVYFLNQDTGFAVGGDASTNSVILKTVNGGATWTTVYSNPTNNYLAAITFSNSRHGFVVGGTQTGGMIPILLYTADGGDTWNNYTPVPGSGDFSSVKFLDTSNGYITGANLFQYGMKTSDGGNTWTNLPLVANDFSTICFATSTKGFITPNIGGMLVTNNGGSTWTTLLSSSVGFLSDMHFTTATTGVAVGATFTDPVILKTTNSGSSWTPVGGFTNGSLDQVSFPDPKNGFAIGFTSAGAPMIISTSDSGNHWDTMPPPVTSATLSSINFPSAIVGYVVGSGGTIFKYRNTAGIKNTTEDNTFCVYPNPVKNTSYWKVNSNYSNTDATVSVYNITGILQAAAPYKTGVLDVSHLPGGMYIFRFGSTAQLIEKD